MTEAQSAPSRLTLPNYLSEVRGPFDIIGDIHGCCDELETLLQTLGYEAIETHPGCALSGGPVFRHPQHRIAVFLGDLVDRGPRIPDTLRLVYNMVKAGCGLSVMGNHDDKLLRKLKGRNVHIKHGLEITLAQINNLPNTCREDFITETCAFLETLAHYYLLDNGNLIVAHAGLKEHMHGIFTEEVRQFTLYGETTGKTDEYGLPIRGDWAENYRGRAMVVYGHTPVPEAVWVHNTINIDTGCVFGGKLTALRYPERELVSVNAREIYCPSPKPFPTSIQTA